MHAPSRTFAALVAASCLVLGCGDDDTGSADERGDVDTQIQDSEGGDSGGTTEEGEGGAVEDGGTGSSGDGTGDSSGNDGDVDTGG